MGFTKLPKISKVKLTKPPKIAKAPKIKSPYKLSDMGKKVKW